MNKPIENPPLRLRPPHDQPDEMRHQMFGFETADEWRSRIHIDNRAALLEQLDGVPLGDYDHRIIDWLARWDVPTIAVVASLLRRAWWAGHGSVCKAHRP
ncbi:hypothetical protein ACFQ34_03860 [Pseudonocardia benzenivorans]|uniref:DUF3263 domain-containing protein n=1 Tax=Pseudonocardia benzenivorans TaxID=228005 RepID=A0ABW3VAS0_9PSEU